MERPNSRRYVSSLVIVVMVRLEPQFLYFAYVYISICFHGFPSL